MAPVFPPLQLASATITDAVSYDLTSSESSISSNSTWEQLDEELRRMLAPISEGLNRDILHTTEAADSFVSVLRDQLIHHGLLKQELQEDDEPHRRRAIVRSRKRLAHAKNIARRSIRSSPREFLTGVRTHNLAVRGERELLRNQSTRRQEKAFQENPWRFAKSACSPSS